MPKKYKMEKSIEKRLEKNLRERVKKLGGICLKMYALSFTGLPDRIALLPKAKVLFAEIKDTGKKPTRRQELVHAFLRSLGFQVWVIDADELVDGFIKTCIHEMGAA